MFQCISEVAERLTALLKEKSGGSHGQKRRSTGQPRRDEAARSMVAPSSFRLFVLSSSHKVAPRNPEVLRNPRTARRFQILFRILLSVALGSRILRTISCILDPWSVLRLSDRESQLNLFGYSRLAFGVSAITGMILLVRRRYSAKVGYREAWRS